MNPILNGLTRSRAKAIDKQFYLILHFNNHFMKRHFESHYLFYGTVIGLFFLLFVGSVIFKTLKNEYSPVNMDWSKYYRIDSLASVKK